MVEDAVPNPDYKPIKSFTLETGVTFLQDCDIYIDGDRIWLLVSTYNPEFFVVDFTNGVYHKVIPNLHPINQVLFLQNIRPHPEQGPQFALMSRAGVIDIWPTWQGQNPYLSIDQFDAGIGLSNKPFAMFIELQNDAENNLKLAEGCTMLSYLMHRIK